MTNREKWKTILPVLQAFCNGMPIQQKGYDGRWKDTDSMYSLLRSEYRVKPGNIVKGKWTAAFTYDEKGVANSLGSHGTAVLEWKGTNQDQPKWPSSSELNLVEGSERFTPEDQIEQGSLV